MIATTSDRFVGDLLIRTGVIQASTLARILMLTSESSIECETAGLAAGADDYILKPVEPRRLAARVQALLARSRAA